MPGSNLFQDSLSHKIYKVIWKVNMLTTHLAISSDDKFPQNHIISINLNGPRKKQRKLMRDTFASLTSEHISPQFSFLLCRYC